MRRSGWRTLGLLLLVGLMAGPAAAGPIHSFTTLTALNSNAEGFLASSATVGPVTASAFYFDTESASWKTSTLTLRNVSNDHGLGNCSPGETCTFPGDGDDNELSQLTKTEAILLTIADGHRWDGLWLSSLDSGGTGGHENGKVYWGNSANLTTLISSGGSATFAHPAFSGGAVEGEVNIGTAYQNFKHVLFVPGSGTSSPGSNEDYLVWGADSVHVPDGGATLSLLGCALLGITALRRKRRG